MPLRKIAIWVVAIVIVLGAAVAGAFQLMNWHFNPEPPAPGFGKPANALEAQRQDLTQLRRLVAMDRSYSDAARAQANARIDALARDTRVLTWGQLRAQAMTIAALADNGHTSVFSGANRRPNFVALRVGAFPDGLHVLRADAANADLLGARVEKIDGQPIEQVMARLELLRGGIAAWRRVNAELWVQSPELLNGTGVAPGGDATVWSLRLKDGALVKRTLKGETLSKDLSIEESFRWLSSEPVEKQPMDWRALDVPLPLALRDFNKTFRRAWIGNSCVLFLQMKAITDGGGMKIADWLRETADAMAAKKPCGVILDLRYNGGGDYTNSWAFTHKLPELMQPGARVALLTGPHTFSAAITTTAFVKETLGDRAVIVGEPVGDRMKFLSEGNSGCLPNSGICFHYATGMHDYAAPCTDPGVCYWLNYFYPVRVKSLAPDAVVPLSFADYLAGRDPAFDKALALVTPH